MDQPNQKLLDAGYTRYELSRHTPGADSDWDEAARRLANSAVEWPVAGSIREETAGGQGLYCWIALEDNQFCVYLPPADQNAFAKSQMHFDGKAVGFSPTQKAARAALKQWLERLH